MHLFRQWLHAPLLRFLLLSAGGVSTALAQPVRRVPALHGQKRPSVRTQRQHRGGCLASFWTTAMTSLFAQFAIRRSLACFGQRSLDRTQRQHGHTILIPHGLLSDRNRYARLNDMELSCCHRLSWLSSLEICRCICRSNQIVSLLTVANKQQCNHEDRRTDQSQLPPW